MKYLILLVTSLALFVSGCGSLKERMEQIKEMERREANGVVKIKIASDGAIYLNKQPASMEAVSKELARIKEVNGVVWYHRASKEQAAETSGMAVIAEITKYKLPVKLVEKDFE